MKKETRARRAAWAMAVDEGRVVKFGDTHWKDYPTPEAARAAAASSPTPAHVVGAGIPLAVDFTRDPRAYAGGPALHTGPAPAGGGFTSDPRAYAEIDRLLGRR